MKGSSFIVINANEANLFARDGKHYNKHGLAILDGLKQMGTPRPQTQTREITGQETRLEIDARERTTGI